MVYVGVYIEGGQGSFQIQVFFSLFQFICSFDFFKFFRVLLDLSLEVFWE